MPTRPDTIDPAVARAFIDDSTFLWHQIWDLAPGVQTPGANRVQSLFDVARLEDDLSGLSVLDVGTTNGASAFEAERRGAARVVAVDMYDESHFGFDQLRTLLRSEVEFVQANVYELASALRGQTFDLILFWGVLYHLRHPILALDNVRAIAAGRVMVETAICDNELSAEDAALPLARFYRKDELGADPTNWFAPTQRLLEDWCASSGLPAETSSSWPGDAPTRGHVGCRVADGVPEAHGISGEVMVTATTTRWPD